MTALPLTTHILTEFDKGWLTIWFNTPANRNALSTELTNELIAVLHAVRDDRSVRGITLRGKGGIFCAGGDLKGFKAVFQGDDADPVEVAAANREAGEMFALINTMPQVVLALVEGAAIAGGIGIVCCADIVGVTKDAKFALTETQIGITPAQIAPYVVQRLGPTVARRLMLTGSRFDGIQAEKLGLADYVSDDATGLDAIEKTVRAEIMRCAPGANATTKKIILATSQLNAEAMRAFAADEFARCMLSDEGREGVAAFVEKRKPGWAIQES